MASKGARSRVPERVRINEVFGDTVNWDLIPSNAIKSITVVAGNPLYGLNTLGGALNISMKDGFGFQGVAAIGIGSNSKPMGSLQLPCGPLWEGLALTSLTERHIVADYCLDLAFSHASICPSMRSFSACLISGACAAFCSASSRLKVSTVPGQRSPFAINDGVAEASSDWDVSPVSIENTVATAA